LAPGATSLDVTFVGDGSRDLLATVDGASGPTVLRVSSDGAVLATSDGTWANPRPSPRGDRLLGVEQRSGAVVEVDPLSLAVTGRPLGGACWPRWVDAATWAATCAGDGTRTALVDASGGVTTMELAVAGSTVPLLLGDDGLLVAVRQWVDGELLADRVVRASPGGATDLSTGLGFVWDARGPALVGVPALPTLGVSQPVLALTAPVVAWQEGEGRATTLVPPGETGVTTVIPVHGPGDGIGGSLVVTETGGLEFRPPD
ncbi:MAG TPA: hypothetical protein PKB06_12490, partial [Actinotalea sp.]|nr:hypothetical protein [Actinotalea sp.]